MCSAECIDVSQCEFLLFFKKILGIFHEDGTIIYILHAWDWQKILGIFICLKDVNSN